jgi:uncharacterized lipoprotein YddW (UPF0748 family)
MKKMFFTLILTVLLMLQGNSAQAGEASCSSYTIDAVNPTAISNPAGAAFPGYRGINQMVVYDARNARKHTGTNEYGVEVVVKKSFSSKQGEIVKITGANTPVKAGETVISAHGSASRWLLAHGKLGSLVKIETVIISDAHWPGDPLYTTRGSEEKVQMLSICENPKADALALKSLMQYAKAQGGKLEDWADYYQSKIKWADRHKNDPEAKRPTSQDLERDLWTVTAPFREEEVEGFIDNQGVWHPEIKTLVYIQGVWHRPTLAQSSEAEIKKTLVRFKDMGINTVFLETFVHGFTMYPSKVYQKYGITPNAYPKLGVVGNEALLARWLRLAHAEGIQVHAWLQVFYVGNSNLNLPTPILAKFPQWRNRQRQYADDPTPHPSPIEQGHWFMDPANPQVRQFLTDVVDELATTYPVDGIQIDYIRYPASLEHADANFVASTWGYTPIARTTFKAKFKVDPLTLTPTDTLLWQAWESFKASQVTQLVRDLRSHQTMKWNAFRASKQFPELKLSAAVFPDPKGSHGIKHQDWPLWMREGVVDYMAPMILSANEAPVCKALKLMYDINPSIPVVPGLFAPFYKSPTLSSLKQLQASFACNGDGFIWFQSDYLQGDLEERLKYRKKNMQFDGC